MWDLKPQRRKVTHPIRLNSPRRISNPATVCSYYNGIAEIGPHDLAMSSGMRPSFRICINQEMMRVGC
jgi:hypothetical protein